LISLLNKSELSVCVHNRNKIKHTLRMRDWVNKMNETATITVSMINLYDSFRRIYISIERDRINKSNETLMTIKREEM